MFVLLFNYIDNSDMQGNPDTSDLVVRTDMCHAQSGSLFWSCT